jgi:divalent metal cation (Fe/Co/Zn/Cd) transporter
MGDDDKSLEELFALKVKPDTRVKQVRFLKPELVKKLQAIKRDMKTNIISVDQFNNKKQKKKENKNDR